MGPIYLLANWRYFGYQNNPIAVYYRYDPTGEQLEYVVAEVTNTPWGERHVMLRAPGTMRHCAQSSTRRSMFLPSTLWI